MNTFTKISCLLRAAPQITVAILIVMLTATSTYAEGRMNLSCNMDKYKPKGRYSVDRLRSWIPDKLRVEVSDDDQVSVYVTSGPAIGRQFYGEVKRENSKKIVMEARQKVRDKLGQEAFMTYTLELFKSSDKLIVNANPQGYRELGHANGKCKSFPVSTGPDNAEEQYRLGQRYESGIGVRQDLTKALKLYRSAADQGHVIAQTQLGFMYRIGRGLPRDYAEALKWYRKAAERGFAPAQRAAAWILATAPDAQLRDGTEAIRLARQAVANSTDTKSLDTLAAAYAEAGQFDKAVEE